jgi:hypothetical protein
LGLKSGSRLRLVRWVIQRISEAATPGWNRFAIYSSDGLASPFSKA